MSGAVTGVHRPSNEAGFLPTGSSEADLDLIGCGVPAVSPVARTQARLPAIGITGCRSVLFTDSTFLLRFLPSLLALFFLALALTPRRWKEGGRRFVLANPVLLAGSLVFLACGAGPFARWLVGAALAAWLAGLATAWARGAGRVSGRFSLLPEALLTVAVTGVAVLFGAFKYARPPQPILDDPGFAIPQLLVPLGLSFVVCHAVSYVVDVHRGEAPAQGNPVTAASYLLFFPLLCAGPLARYRDIAPQLTERRATMAAFAYGVRRWLVGFWKVAFLASALAGPADAAFALPSGALGPLQAWVGAACFGLQVYFSLSGYADMAIGFARMFGFRLAENFRWPYGADSVTAFWRRWFVTLFAWFRDCLGLSLDPSGGRPVARAGRILLLFAGIGIWHGPGWNVLTWALLHGGVVGLEQAGLGARLARWPRPLRHGYVLLTVLCLWVVFRADTLPDAGVMFAAMSGLSAATDVAPLALTRVEWAAFVIGGLSVVPLWSGFSRWLVTVDALTTSILFLVSTSVLFVWRCLANAVLFVVGRRWR